MNFLSNLRSNGRDSSYTSSSLVDLISHEDWLLAKMELETHPREASTWHKRSGFFDGCHDSTVLPLHIAVSVQPTAEIVDSLIKAYPESVECVEPTFKRNALHIACQTAAPTCAIEVLLDRFPAGARARDALSRIPLHYCCSHAAPIDVCRALLQAFPAGASIADRNGWLPLHVACRIGESPEVIEELLTAFPESIGSKTNKGSTPLACALKHEGVAVGKDDKVASESVIRILKKAMEERGLEVAADKK